MKRFNYWIPIVFLLFLNSIVVRGSVPFGEFLKTESESHEFEHLKVVMPQDYGRTIVWHKLRIRLKNFQNFIFDEEFNYWLDSTKSLQFETLDINLDGYSDFIIQSFEQQHYYIYDPISHQFNKNSWLSCSSKWNFNPQKSNLIIVLDKGSLLQKLTLHLPSMEFKSAYQFSANSQDSIQISENNLKCPLSYLNHNHFEQPKLNEVNNYKVNITPQKFHFFMGDTLNIVLHDEKLSKQLINSKLVIEQFNEHYKVWDEFKIKNLLHNQKLVAKNGKTMISLGICDETGYPLFSGYSFISGQFRIKIFSKGQVISQTNSFFVHH